MRLRPPGGDRHQDTDWALENDARYEARKQAKKEVYAKYGFPLMELVDADVQNLDDVLPARFLKCGIWAY